jgi:TRAP-type C4-dicarboxylate transport system permease small subunit
LKAVHTFDGWLARLEEWLVLLSFLGILAIGLLQIFLSKFGAGFTWADEVMQNLTLWVGFLAASLATRAQKHITIDAFSRLLRGRLKHGVSLLVNLTAAGVCAAFFYAGLQAILKSGRLVETGAIPVNLWKAIFLLGFGVMGFRFLLRTAQAAQALVHGDGASSSSAGGPPP